MATIKKYNGSTWENTTARKYETKSEIITPPTTIYADGTAITAYTIKGNTVQNGTPTPSNPVPVVGVGELETSGEHSGEYKIPISSSGVTTNIYLGSTQTVRQIKKLVLTGNEAFVKNYDQSTSYLYYALRADILPGSMWKSPVFCNELPVKTEPPVSGIGINSNNETGVVYLNFEAEIMNAQSSGNTVAGLKEYLAAQYANGTPVTVWYVLDTAETAAVNEPLMKIGTYADTLSNAMPIPTTEGANSITVDTTVQPSEFTATWTGWHNASVKEWDGSDWS